MDLDAPDGDVAHDRCILWEQSVLWVFPSAFRGVLKRNLLQKDYPGLPARLSSSGGLARSASDLRGTGLNLSQVIWKLMWVEVAVALFLGIVQGLLAVVARPLMLKAIIDVVAQEEEERETDRVTLLVVLAGVVVTMEGLCMAGSKHALGERFSSGALTVVIALLHDKCWRIPDGATKVEVVNIVGSDCVRCLELMKTLSLSPASFTILIGGVIVIYTTLDPVSASVGLGTICVLLTGNAMLARVARRAEEQNLACADERIRIMEQLITGIRAVKLSAWEENYLDKIRHARMVESGPMRKFRILIQAQIQIGRANPILAACVTFCVFGLRGGQLEPGTIFAVLNVFLGMKVALIGLPDTMSVLTSVSVVEHRIEAYLNLPEVVSTTSAAAGAEMEPVASISGFEASWADTAFQLNIPSFTILPGQLVAVVGHVASGKSSLLMALLGELGSSQGNVSYRGTLGYVGQEPFVLADTVRTNIVMGRRYDEELLGEALWRAALEQDVAKLSMHVDTFIGEHGVSMSGGQQQRLALARAFYGKPTLLLCDDPLSALDAPTGEAVFERGLRPYTADGRAAVVVLNQDHLLPHFDAAYELEDGMAKLRPLGPARGVAMSLAAQQETPASFCSFVTVPLDSRASKNGRFTKEAQASGVVSLAVMRRYIVGFQGKGKDGPCRYSFFAITIGSTLLTQAVAGFADRWLAHWVDVADSEPDTAPGPYVAVYFAACVGFFLLLQLSSALFAIGGVRSGRELHEDCITRLLHAPLHFFEATPSGRILSRFSSDLGSVDLTLSRWFDNLAQVSSPTLMALVQIVLILPVVAAPIAFSLILYLGVTVAANTLSREAKRLQNAGMAPVHTSMREAAGGRVVVRAMGLGPFLNERLVFKSDALARFFYFGNSVLSWAMLMSYVSGGITTTVAVFVAMHLDVAENSSNVALALTYCLALPYLILSVSLCSLSLFQSLPSLERLLQYSNGSYVPQEAAWEMPGDALWKGAGAGGMEIIFEDVHFSYVTGRLPVLRGASFRFSAGESIGVVGRTGAGKSTLLLLLLRVREPSAGRILLGGQDAQTLGLMALRRAVGVIPQTPLIISGTLRQNLDPWGEHSDDEILKAIHRVRLGVHTPSSDAAPTRAGHRRRVGTGGSAVLEEDAGDLSAGEHQLLSLARCLLGKHKLRAVLLDEPTSNIDLETDEIAESVINEDLGHLTMVEIAHRLHDVVDSDRVLVMDQGAAFELGTPVELLADPDSHFTGMARALGPEIVEELQTLARSFAQGSRAAATSGHGGGAGAVQGELADTRPVLPI